MSIEFNGTAFKLPGRCPKVVQESASSPSVLMKMCLECTQVVIIMSLGQKNEPVAGFKKYSGGYGIAGGTTK